MSKHMKDARNRAIWHRKVRGVPFGVYEWRRTAARGLVVRLGPVGHVQAQVYWRQHRGTSEEDGRRPRYGLMLSCWGVRGRRHKRALDISVLL